MRVLYGHNFLLRVRDNRYKINQVRAVDVVVSSGEQPPGVMSQTLTLVVMVHPYRGHSKSRSI